MRRSTYEAVEIGWGEGEKGRRGGVGRCWRERESRKRRENERERFIEVKGGMHWVSSEFRF